MAAGVCECLLRGWILGSTFYSPIFQLGLFMVLVGEAVRKIAMVRFLEKNEISRFGEHSWHG